MIESDGKSFKFTVAEEIDPNDIVELLVTAFDSGSTNYWAGEADVILPDDFDIYSIPWLKNPDEWDKVRKVYIAPLVKGGQVVLKDNEEDKVYRLDIDAIELGIKIMASKYRRHWNDFRTENGDAMTGDVFVQCCIFGEVIFG